MPRMDGLTFLRKLMQFHPLPAVVISSLAQKNCSAALDAMAFGAVEVLAKPGGPYSVGELRLTLADKIRAAALAKRRNVEEMPQPAPLAAGAFTPGAVIAIGASTGGTEAIAAIMKSVPPDAPPIVIAQHIPPVFSRAFAERLNANCAMEVKEAADGDELRPGLALVAPGDYHMLLRKRAGGYRVEVKTGPRVCYQRPSVDVLFFSVAEAAGLPCHRRAADGHGFGWRRGIAQDAPGRRAHHRAGRSHMRHFRHAARSDRTRRRATRTAAAPDRERDAERARGARRTPRHERTA